MYTHMYTYLSLFFCDIVGASAGEHLTYISSHPADTFGPSSFLFHNFANHLIRDRSENLGLSR